MQALIGMKVPYLENETYVFEDFDIKTEFLIIIEEKKVYNIIWRFNNTKEKTIYRSARKNWINSQDVMADTFCTMYFENSLNDLPHCQSKLACRIREINNLTVNRKNLPRQYRLRNTYEKEFPSLTTEK